MPSIVYAGGGQRIEVQPGFDGVTHINIYSEGKTELGRRLTNFSKNDFEHPVFGWFQSMEAFWYWCSTGYKHEHFRSKWGIDAKRAGQSKPKIPSPDFKQHLIEGLHCKLAYWPDIYKLLSESTLPLTHYYVLHYSVVATQSFDFLLDELELIRSGKPLMFQAPIEV